MFHPSFVYYNITQFSCQFDSVMEYKKSIICDRIWENPQYGIRVRFAQCAFLVAQVEICQSPDFVIHVEQPFF